MGRFICKVEREGEPLYFEWSTIVDAPVTYGMTLEQFHQHYREQYGEEGMRGLPERMARVEATGTSSRMDDSLEELIECNRAGDNEEHLTLEQIIETLIPDGEG